MNPEATIDNFDEFDEAYTKFAMKNVLKQDQATNVWGKQSM